MPRKSFYKSRRTRRRMGYRKRGPMRRGLAIPTRTYKFIRYTGGTIGVGGAVGTGYGAFPVSLSLLPSATEFVNLFDQYRILGFRYRFRITFDPMLSTATKSYPTLVWVQDKNSSDTPVSLNEILQYQGVKWKTFGDSAMTTKWHYLRPTSSLVGYETAVLSAYNAKFGVWWDANDSTTQHNTIRYAYDSLYTGVSIYCDYALVLEFKGVR